MNLAASELLRLLHRPMVRWIAACFAAICLAATVIVAARSVPPPGGIPVHGTFELANLPDILANAAVILGALGFVVGASAVGADASTGAFATLLTWEPRRARVLVTRAMVAAVVAAAVTVCVLTLLAVGLSLAAGARGSTLGTGADFWTEVVAQIGRTGAAAGVCAVAGAGATAIFRTSTGPIVAFLVLGVIAEPVAVQIDGLGWYERVAPATNLLGFAYGSPGVDGSLPLTALVAGLTAAILLAVGGVVLQAREIR